MIQMKKFWKSIENHTGLREALQKSLLFNKDSLCTRSTNRLKHTGNQFRDNLEIKGACIDLTANLHTQTN